MYVILEILERIKYICNTLIFYEPFECNLQQNYDECGFANPLRCELGDQANKLGKYDVGKGRRFYTDVYLPLMGQFGGTFFFKLINLGF